MTGFVVQGHIYAVKAAVRKFCLFVAISVWKPVIVVSCRMYSGTASVQMNLMFWGECVAVSHRTGVDVYCTSQSQILACVLEYMTQIRIFTVYCHLNK